MARTVDIVFIRLPNGLVLKCTGGGFLWRRSVDPLRSIARHGFRKRWNLAIFHQGWNKRRQTTRFNRRFAVKWLRLLIDRLIGLKYQPNQPINQGRYRNNRRVGDQKRNCPRFQPAPEETLDETDV